MAVVSPESWCRSGQRSSPEGSVTSQSQTPCTPGCCWSGCCGQPGLGGRSSSLPGTSCQKQCHAAYQPAGWVWTGCRSATERTEPVQSENERHYGVFQCFERSVLWRWFVRLILTRRKESRAPFSIYSVRIMTGQLAVMIPSRWIMLGCWNCPMMDASDRKSRLCLSV